ncbi:RHS repeat-associated core domain-containing protein [Burkholderia cenocepacia]|uniref:RHS repeat-associated core domain-containing protein n=1 Tax=Burkholderia cenocepacia TaxID=95486 RepID=UPI001FC82421|nr:RHS repeat-associated core domain-containing protein [Burkholderia cenocepacia]
MNFGGISGLGAVLAKMPGIVLPFASASPVIDRLDRLGDALDRYRIRCALSGMHRDSIDAISGGKLCLAAGANDFELLGRLPLRWSRRYASTCDAIGLLGVGWRTCWESTLRKAGERLVYMDEHGNTLDVPFPERGTQVIAVSEQLHFAHFPDGRLVVADLKPHYRIFGDFDENGIARLKYIEDPNGQRIGCIWDAAGRLLGMRGTCGHELKMHYDEAKGGERLGIIECIDGGRGGAIARYGYSENGELTEVRNRIGAIACRFAWQDGRIVEATDPLGVTTRYAWETIGGVARVVERATSEGERERFVYDIERRVTRVTDVFGHDASWQYDRSGRVQTHIDFDGRCYCFDYSDAALPTHVQLPGGREIRFEYDSLGRVAKETDPAGATRVTHYAFATYEPVSMTMSDGRTWMWVRNDRFQPVRYRVPSGESVRFEYGDDGCLARTVDAQGMATTYERDTRGRMIRRTTAAGDSTHYEYDVDGHVVGITDALGATTRIERDGLGRPVAVMRSDGRVERYIWNAAGQPISYYGPGGRSRHWHRDRRGNVVRTVDEEGNWTARQYDVHGRLIRVENANGVVRTLEWGAGHCLSITDADGVVRRFDYTDAGQLAGVTSTAGRHVRRETFAYDSAGRLVQRVTQHSRYTYRYTVRGELEAVDRTPTTEGELLGIGADQVWFRYDGRGRLVEERGANGELHYTYNATGRLVAMQLPQGKTVLIRRLVTGDVARIELDDRPIAHFWYDAMRRPIARTQGRLRTHSGYSTLGLPVWWRSVGIDEPTDVAAPDAEVRRLRRGAEYGPGDLIVRMDGPDEEAVWYDYDRRGCLLRRVSDQAGIEYFTWDAVGNLLDTPGRNWLPVVDTDHRIRECRGYRYEYDVWGNLARKVGHDCTLSLVWDVEGRIISAHRNGRTVRYRYDALGRRIAKYVEFDVLPRSGEATRDELVRYVWQGSRLIQEQRANGLRTYLYQPEPGGSTGFAPLARVDQALTDGAATVDAEVYHYHTDGIGTAIALTDEAGNVVWRARYRAWGRCAAARERGGGVAIDQLLRYAGQYADEETGLHYNGARFYDPDAGRYVSPDRVCDGSASPYRYAPNSATWCNPRGRAKPERSPGFAAGEASDNDGVLDPAQQIAAAVEQFDGISAWDVFER